MKVIVALLLMVAPAAAHDIGCPHMHPVEVKKPCLDHDHVLPVDPAKGEIILPETAPVPQKGPVKKK